MSNCSGLKFRGRSQNYFNKKTMRFEHKESLTLLKRESCKCDACKTAIIDIEECGQDMIDYMDWRLFTSTEDKEVEDMGKYNASVSWDSDGDSCYVDELYFSKER
jgi:hypothetical protein